MLSSNYLQKIITKYQTSDLNVRREYAQHVLLSYLYQQKTSGDLYFKGGTALRLIYKSPRFSEDLDFDTTIHEKKVWESAIESMLVAVSHEGIEPDIRESKSTSGGYLVVIVLKKISDPITIHFEISFRKDIVEGEVFSIDNDFMTPYPVKSLKTVQLVDGKLQALFDRQKARDFYDLYFLLRANLLNTIQKKQLAEVKKLLQKTKINFHRELSVFLPKSQSLLVSDFKTTLIREIERSSS